MASTTWLLILGGIVASFVQILCLDTKKMSVVIGKETGDAEEFIQIINPPESIDNGKLLTVEYTCTENGLVAVEVIVKKTHRSPALVYRKHWRCDSSHFVRRKKIRLRLEDSLGYRPGYVNKEFNFGFKPDLRAFLLKEKYLKIVPNKALHFGHAKAAVSYSVFVTLPYSRPPWRPYKGCAQWYVKIFQRIPGLNNRMCPYEFETIQLLKYPAVFNGMHYGIYRHFPPYRDAELERLRRSTLTRPSFTLSMWLYMIDFCPPLLAKTVSCGIFMHVSWNNLYMSPLLMVDSDGYPRVEAILEKDRKHVSHKIHFQLPKHQWIRVILGFTSTSWNFFVNYGANRNLTYSSEFDYNENVILDDTEGDFIIGGNDALVNSFVGYVGEVTFYRRRNVQPSRIPFPSPYHPMFELGLTRREEKCQNFLNWLNSQVDYYKNLYREKSKIKRDVCQDVFHEMLTRKPNLQCPVRNAAKPKKFRILNTFIRQSVRKGTHIGHQGLVGVATDIFNNATALIEDDLAYVPDALPLLRQASCLGNYDAMYMLSVILNNGLMVKSNEIQAQAYLMLCALDQHRLCSMALGHKHMHGIDGAPFDKAQAYFYYKYVAGKTRDDRESHKDTDVITESVRLTDELTLKQQTDEEGDVFLWLKHQAMAGVTSAQIQMGRALFWGSQGLRRNVQAAMEVFRAGADQGNPDMMYDYGINIYNGRAKEKNKTKGIEYMKRAAKKNHPMAVNGLGYIALVNRNYTEAVEYFNRAYRLGNGNSAYYLGHMYLEGYHPTDKQDWDKAYKYFEFAAVRGHHDAGVLFAYISMKGTSRMSRNIVLATEWARFIAEQNPAVGGMLRKGLHAYRNGNMPLAFFYYLLAADSGLEVASFNLAWLCDENKDGLVTQMEKDCAWRHFNLSIQRELHQVDAYALIKMGDYFWYGCKGTRDIKKASGFYANAAVKGDPHALFNLAFMVEEGVPIPEHTWNILSIPRKVQSNNVTLLTHLYSRCKESRKTEAFIPCTLALYKVQFVDVWTRYHIWMKLSSIVGVSVVVTTSLITLYHHFKTRRPVDELI